MISHDCCAALAHEETMHLVTDPVCTDCRHCMATAAYTTLPLRLQNSSWHPEQSVLVVLLMRDYTLHFVLLANSLNNAVRV